MDGKIEQLLKLGEVAKLLGVQKRTVYRLIASDALPQPVKVGRSSRMPGSDVSAYLERIKRERNR